MDDIDNAAASGPIDPKPADNEARPEPAHWGPGGHKKYCGAAAASPPQASSGGPATDLGAADASGSDTNAAGCIICLDAEGELLQRGCCCRGDAGLAHLHCLVELAVGIKADHAPRGVRIESRGICRTQIGRRAA